MVLVLFYNGDNCDLKQKSKKDKLIINKLKHVKILIRLFLYNDTRQLKQLTQIQFYIIYIIKKMMQLKERPFWFEMQGKDQIKFSI